MNDYNFRLHRIKKMQLCFQVSGMKYEASLIILLFSSGATNPLNGVSLGARSLGNKCCLSNCLRVMNNE